MAIVFESASAKDIIRRLLRIPEKLFYMTPGSIRYKLYTMVYVMGNIKIYTECIPTEQNPYGLGSYLVISGKGCSQLQTYFGETNRSLLDFFADCIKLYRNQFHFTRMDIAIDDQNTPPYFTVEQIKKKCIDREFQSRSRNFRFQESSFQDGSTALTVYIGDRKSNIMYRFYDKDKEQANKLNIPLSQIGTWKRTELELKDEIAQSFVEEVGKRTRSLEELAKDFLGANLRFVEPDCKQKNKSRWQTSSFWNDFLGEIKPLKLIAEPEPNTLHETQAWLKNGGVLSAVKAFEILEAFGALGNLADLQSLKSDMKFSQALSEKIIIHLTMMGREDVMPYIYENTKR